VPIQEPAFFYLLRYHLNTTDLEDFFKRSGQTGVAKSLKVKNPSKAQSTVALNTTLWYRYYQYEIPMSISKSFWNSCTKTPIPYIDKVIGRLWIQSDIGLKSFAVLLLSI
jgi:hypothetical protein